MTRYSLLAHARPVGRAVVLAAALAVALIAGAANATEQREAAAVAAARAWLALVDGGDYRQSWRRAAGYLKGAIDREQWTRSLVAYRQPLGKVLSRTVGSRTFATELPGAPDGQYVVIRFQTTFEHKRSGVETVTPMLEKDGGWRVAGYYIK